MKILLKTTDKKLALKKAKRSGCSKVIKTSNGFMAFDTDESYKIWKKKQD